MDKNYCICRHCNSIYDYSELDYQTVILYDIEIKEKRCPFCKNHIVPIDSFSKYLLVNDDRRYYEYSKPKKQNNF